MIDLTTTYHYILGPPAPPTVFAKMLQQFRMHIHQQIAATYHLSPCQNGSSVALVRAVRPSPTSTCSAVWSDPACVSKDDVNGVLGGNCGKVFLASIGGMPTLLTSKPFLRLFSSPFSVYQSSAFYHPFSVIPFQPPF
ncbi:hypothetical protein DL93DRAFT_1098272 [Clavulina sp. PMI_390]|nr:hypothetical protein DL93DRAFT_1098272 [Clavulina sp. PMI_390]